MKHPVSVGPLRLVLLAFATAAVVAAPFAGGALEYTFPEVIPTLVAPPFAVMMEFVLALDMLMSWIFTQGRELTERRRLRRIIGLEAIMLGVLVAAWAPFFSAIGTR